MLSLERSASAVGSAWPYAPGPMVGYFAPRLSSALLFLPAATYARFATALVVLPLPIELVALLTADTLTFALVGGLALLLQAAPFLVPSILASRRKRGVEAELPFVAMLLYILSHESFPNIPDAFSKIDELGRGVLPAFCKEASGLKRDLTYGRRSEFELIEECFRHHPSRQFRDFVHGYLSALTSGRDVHEFVRLESDRLTGLLLDRWKAFSGQLSSMSEIAFIFLAIFPIGMQMVAGAFAGANSSTMLLLSVALLAFAAIGVILWIDYAQPSLYDRRVPTIRVAAPVALLCSAAVFYSAGTITAAEAAFTSLTVSAAFVFASRRFFGGLRQGERDIASLLHQLSEDIRAGAGIPAALAKVRSTQDLGSLSQPLTAFTRALALGRTPSQAQRAAAHPSWLVKVSFSLLAASIETGGGYEQIDRLSHSFRRVIDSRRSIQSSVLPFVVLGAAVPAISVVSYWLLSNMQGLSFLLPGFTPQSSSLAVGTSILATSILTGLIVSKAYSLSFRSLVGLPPILLSALVSFLLLGFP